MKRLKGYRDDTELDLSMTELRLFVEENTLSVNISRLRKKQESQGLSVN